MNVCCVNDVLQYGRPHRRRWHACTFVGALAFLIAGCQTAERRIRDMQIGPGTDVTNVYAPGPMSRSIRQVGILPVQGLESAEESERIHRAFTAELQRTGRFLVRTPGTAAASADDAVLQIDVLHFRPYKPIEIGVRVTLARTDDGTVLWAVDEHFNSGDPEVTRSAGRFAKQRYGQGAPGTDPGAVLISPTRFAHFVAALLFETLPPLDNSVLDGE